MDDFATLLDAVNRNAADEVSAILQRSPQLVHRRDAEGATALHYAAFNGTSDIARALIQHGADINARDGRFGATPAGWAIEYLRELGGFLGIELADFAFALERGDAFWVRRFLARFPAVRHARDLQGRSFEERARQSGNPEIVHLFEASQSGEG
jgi:ankyrin repeat protein